MGKTDILVSNPKFLYSFLYSHTLYLIYISCANPFLSVILSLYKSLLLSILSLHNSCYAAIPVHMSSAKANSCCARAKFLLFLQHTALIQPQMRIGHCMGTHLSLFDLQVCQYSQHKAEYYKN